VSSAKCVINIHIAQLTQAGSERLDCLGVSLCRGPVFILDFAFFLNMKTQIFQQNHITGFDGIR